MKNFISGTSALGINIDPNSARNRFRRSRFAVFAGLVKSVLAEKDSCRILDVGGTHSYWQAFGEQLPDRTTVTLLNTSPDKESDTQIISHRVGDACAMTDIADDSYDIVHSNSVIEHVGLWPRMEAMASEVKRVAPRHFVQTPNYWFPIEPHARAAFFHMLPEPWRRSRLMKKRHGFWPKAQDVASATLLSQSAVLLDYQQLAFLFPDSEIRREHFLGLTKSLIAIKGL